METMELFKEVELTAEQEKHLQKIFANLDEEDFSFEVKYGIREVEMRVLSSVSGWLSLTNMPFRPVFRAAIDYAWKRYEFERRK